MLLSFTCFIIQHICAPALTAILTESMFNISICKISVREFVILVVSVGLFLSIFVLLLNCI